MLCTSQVLLWKLVSGVQQRVEITHAVVLDHVVNLSKQSMVRETTGMQFWVPDVTQVEYVHLSLESLNWVGKPPYVAESRCQLQLPYTGKTGLPFYLSQATDKFSLYILRPHFSPLFFLGGKTVNSHTGI